MSATVGPLLRVVGLRVAFPDGTADGNEVVHGLDLELAAGEVLALVGESGSGKSVTAMAVLRLLAARTRVSGSVVFDGQDLLTVPAEAIRAVRGARIGTVFQEPMASWNPVQTIGTQIREAIRAHGDVPSADARERVLELLATAGLADPARIAASFPHQLSGGQLQRAMIAMATSNDPEVIIADEPTTALDVTVQAGVLDLLRRLAAGGTAILLITHDMGVVADLADRVVVLRDGHVVEAGDVQQVLARPREEYTRALLEAVPRAAGTGSVAPVLTKPSAGSGPVAASLAGVEVVYPGGGTFTGRAAAVRAVDGVDLDLVAGRTLGLVGESGSGKSTVGRVLAGLVRPTAGAATVGGVDLAGLSGRALRRVRRDVGIVFQDPGSSLNPKHSVARSITEPLRLAGWSRARAAARVGELLDAVRLERAIGERYPHQLSGGQRQRVAIARALALKPTVLIADEPTSALDVSVQARVLELLRELQGELGFACLFVSHDLAVVAAIAHDVAVMRDGRVVEAGPSATVLASPREEYTRRLLASAPVADPAEQRRRRELRLSLAGTTDLAGTSDLDGTTDLAGITD